MNPAEPPIVAVISTPNNESDIADDAANSTTEAPNQTLSFIKKTIEETQQIKTSKSSGETVWINTKSGYRYHRRSCQYVKSSSTSVWLETAKLTGYTPCKKCSPRE